MKKSLKILVTGAAGMAGRNLVDVLRRAGYSSLLTPRSSDVDLRDPTATKTYMLSERPEAVIHLAARVGGIRANMTYPAEFLSENMLIASSVIGAAAEAKVSKFINLGSACMYPRECAQPMREEMILTGPLEPTNEGYAIAKIAAAKLCRYLHAEHGLNAYTLVVPNLYGPYDRFDPELSHVIAALLLKFHRAVHEKSPTLTMWGTGTARREFLYAGDLAEALTFFLENVDADDLELSELNVGSGSDISIRELAEIVRDTVGFTGTIVWDSSKPDGMPRRLLDSARSHRFDWRPKTDLREGIRLTYDYFRSLHP